MRPRPQAIYGLSSRPAAAQTCPAVQTSSFLDLDDVSDLQTPVSPDNLTSWFADADSDSDSSSHSYTKPQAWAVSGSHTPTRDTPLPFPVSPISSKYSSDGPDDIFTAAHSRGTGSMDSNYTLLPPSRPSCDSDVAVRHSRQQQLENLLLSTSRVGNACLVSPRAGPFAGQLVAAVATASQPPGTVETRLLPETEDGSCRRRINALRTTVREWGSDFPRPDVWIALQTMATDDKGRPDVRKLHAWTQNLTDADEKHIMDLQFLSSPPRKQLAPSRSIKRSPSRPQRPKPITSESQILPPKTAADHHLVPTADTNELDLFPLSVMQQLYFRTSMARSVGALSMSGPGFRFSQSILLSVQGTVELAAIESAIGVLTSRHSMLRARFRLTPDGWGQIVEPPGPASYRFSHQYANGDEDIVSAMEQAQSTIDVLRGPVFAVEHIRCRDGRQLLYLVAHHLVVDLTSWRILAHDLDQLLQKDTLASQASMPFPNWVDYQSYEANQALIEPTLPFQVGPANLKYWDLEDKSNCYGDTAQMSFSLSHDVASSLRTTCRDVLRTDASDFFLAALLYSFYLTFTDREAPTAWKQEQGRDSNNPDFNIDDTVGWFTTLCPVSVPISSAADFVQLLKLIKDTRRAIPRNGVPFFTSRFAETAAIPLEIMFNCVDTLPQIQPKAGFLEPVAAPDHATHSFMSDVGPQVGRIALFEVSVVIEDAGARVEMLYNRSARHRGRIEAWMQKCEHLVLEGVGRLRLMEPELTLADAPLLLGTSYDGISKLTTARLAEVGLDSVASIQTLYPVSPVQQEILVAQGQDAECFHASTTYELIALDQTPINQDRLCVAWETIVATHPVLRSIFITSVSEKGLFDQIVLKAISPAMLFLDADDPVATLASVPPMKGSPSQPKHRLSVCKGFSRMYVRLDASEALCDSATLHNLIIQLSQAYAGNPPIKGTRLSSHLHNMSSRDTSYSLVVWKSSLAGAEPCAFPRLAQAGRPQSRHLSLDISRDEVLAFCKAREIGLSCALQLAWALVLRLFVGKDNVSFGYQASGRDDKLCPDMAEAVGSFATVQPRFLDFSKSQTISSSLDTLKQRCLQTSKSPVPTMSEVEHALGFNDDSLFNTCLSFHESPPRSKWNLQSSLISSTRQSDCEVSLSTMFIDDKLHADLGFRHMSSNQARNITGTFEAALRAILHDPSQRVADADLFTERENAQLTVRDCDSGKPGQRVAVCLHRVIKQYCQDRPDATAICAWDGNLTYRQLDVFGTRLATYLKNLGVGPGTVVPVVLERCLWSPVILLAVLQAGGCFVSLDCQDKATVESTIKQINPVIAIATETAWRFVNGLVSKAVLVNYSVIDTLPPQISLTGPDPAPEHAACMFFSPGQSDTRSSKGIFFTHASLSSAFSVQGPALGIDQDSRVMQLSAFNMDISVVEIMCTLFHGGCVCVPSANERVHDIAGAIARMDVTWSYMTTAIARRIDPITVPSLRTLCFRTRTLHQDIYVPWLKTADVLLAYGAPDVCPLAISVAKVSSSTQPNIIGPPLMGRFWILNPEDPMKLVPIGAIGELAIDSPILIPHRYIPGRPLISPSRRQESSRAHCLRTGHRVRYLDGGHVQFLSSMRDEVLVDGYPIALADAEQRLRQCLGREVDIVVDVVSTSDSIRLLAAFIELGDKYFVGSSDLGNLSFQTREKAFRAKQRVQAEISCPTGHEKRLPPHYMPSIFVPLRRFPLSTSLKVKRRRLQRMVASFSYAQLVETSTIPSDARMSMLQDKPLPLTRTEVSMRRVWAGVVGKLEADITSSDRFFDVGGNRFLAAKLILACRQKGFNISLQRILSGATLTETSQALDVIETPIRTVEGKPAPSQVEPGLNNRFIRKLIAPHLNVHWRDIADVAEASSHQIRSLERSMLTERADTFSLVVHFNGPVQQNRLEAACEALVKRHPILRTAFAVHACRVYQAAIRCFNPRFQRHFCPPGRLDILTEQVTQQDRRLEFRMNDPATRFTFLDGSQGGRLVVRLSATQFTASSAPLLIRDLIALYGDSSYAPGQPTFFDYMRASHGAPHQESIQFWKKVLDGASMTNFVTHSRPPIPSFEVRTLCENVRVNSLGPFGLSFDTVLKAAWSVVLATLSGNSDVVFGQSIEGSHRIASAEAGDSAVAGPLTHMVPIRIRLPSKAGMPLDFMQQVQGSQLASLPFEWLSTLELVRECTKWAPWTRFSTVVQHRSQYPSQESATLNLGSTPFTYSVSESLQREVAEVFVCSTTTHLDQVALSLTFAESQVPPRVAQDALNLLIKTIESLTSYDNITKPNSLLSVETIRHTPKIPLPNKAPEPKKTAVGVSLPSDQRHALQLFITTAWTDILNPIPSNVSESQIHKARFYDIWGCLLPAQLLAEHMTQRLPELKILGFDGIRLSAQDILQHHTMQSQYDLLLLKRPSVGHPTRRKTVSLGSAAAAAGLGNWASSNTNWSLSRKPSMRVLRGLERRSSMRDLSIKAGDWFRDRVVHQGKDRLALAIQDVPLKRMSIISGWGIEPAAEPTAGAVEIGSSEGPREAA